MNHEPKTYANPETHEYLHHVMQECEKEWLASAEGQNWYKQHMQYKQHMEALDGQRDAALLVHLKNKLQY